MANFPRSLNYELPNELQFDKYAQQILENSKTIPRPIASTPTITTLDAATSSDFLQKLGASLLNSIQLQSYQKVYSDISNSAGAIGSDLNSTENFNQTTTAASMDLNFIPHRAIIDSTEFDAMDGLQRQLAYDKFMNEVWIGIVLTLILISMIFCICSCFLYHQFSTWKRNYYNTVAQSQNTDSEAAKLQTDDFEDPVPEYTLVSGLPSYEAALELLQRSPKNSCVIVYPSVFNVFNRNDLSATTTNAEVTTPLLHATTPIAQTAATMINIDDEKIALSESDFAYTLTCVDEKTKNHIGKSSITLLESIEPTTTTTAYATAITTPTVLTTTQVENASVKNNKF